MVCLGNEQRSFCHFWDLSSQGYGFSSGHVWMWKLDYKESWAEKLRVPWTARSVLGVHWRDWCEAETPILRPPDVESWLTGKDPDSGKNWGQEKWMTEDKMVGWHHWHNGHGFGWTPGVGDGQEGLVCRGSWGRKESDTTEGLNWTDWSNIWKHTEFYKI